MLCSIFIALFGTSAHSANTTPSSVSNTTPAIDPAATSNSSFKVPDDSPAVVKSNAVSGNPKELPGVMNCNYKIPLETKKVEQNIVLDWSKNAVIQAFSFKAEALDDQIKKLQACFTEQGWTGFNNALQKSGNIEAIKSQKLSLNSQLDGLALVTEVKDAQWKLSIPIVVEYQNDKEKVSQLLSIDLTVNRKASGDLGISQMIASPRGSIGTKNTSANTDDSRNTTLNVPSHDDLAPSANIKTP